MLQITGVYIHNFHDLTIQKLTSMKQKIVIILYSIGYVYVKDSYYSIGYYYRNYYIIDIIQYRVGTYCITL